MAANLQLVVSAVNHASGTLKDVERDTDSLSGKLGTGLKVAGLAAAAGIGIAVVAGIDFVKQAMEEEAGIARLAAAIDANGGSWEKQGAAIETAIKAREKLSFSDDDLRSSLAMLTAQTGSVDEALNRQVIAMDLARGAGIDLGTASKLLGKVTDESHGALSRLGIVVDKDADSMEVMAAVQARFGGQAGAFAETAQGKWARVGIAFDNIKETIGTALLPVVTKLGDKLASFLEEHEDDIQRITEAFVAWATEAIPKVVKGVQDIIDKVGPLLQKLVPIGDWFVHNKTAITAAAVAIGSVLVAAFLAWAVAATAAAIATLLAAAPIIALVLAIALLAAGIYLLVTNFDEVKKKVMEIVNQIKDAVVGAFQSVIDWLKGNWPLILAVIMGPFGLAILGIITFKDDIWRIISSIPGKLLELVSSFANAAISLGSSLVNPIIDLASNLVTTVVNTISGLPGKLLGYATSFANAGIDLGRGFANGYITGVNRIINAINSALEINVDLGSVMGKSLGSININPPDIPNIPYLATGTAFVPRDTLAFLHRGEAVIPANQMGGMGNTYIFQMTYQGESSQAAAERMGKQVINAVRRELRH